MSIILKKSSQSKQQRIRIRVILVTSETNLIFISFIKLFNDGVIGFGVHRFARLAHRYTKVYYYQNSYVGRFSHTYYPDDKPYGMHYNICS